MKHNLMKIGAPIACLALSFVACSSEPSCVNDDGCDETKPSSETQPNEPEIELDEIQYVGGTTDEALAHLTDVAPEESDEHKLVLSAPASAQLSKASVPKFEFHVQGSQGRRFQSQPKLETSDSLLPPWLTRAGREFAALLGPIRSAHAHGAPFNGQGFYLRFVDAKGAAVASVFTASGSYAPSAASWEVLAAAKQPLSLHIDWAQFEENEVVQDGGPFVGLKFEFSIVE